MTKSRNLRTPKGVSLAFFRKNVIRVTDECVLWPYATDTPGYGRVWVGGRLRSTHIMACEYAQGPKPSPDHQVAHSCRARLCFNPRHLRWATAAENNADKVAHGTSQAGESSPHAKLSASDVLEIRRRFSEGEGQSAISQDYPQVGYKNIHQIVTRKRWKSI